MDAPCVRQDFFVSDAELWLPRKTKNEENHANGSVSLPLGATFIANLSVCTKNKDLQRGTKLHLDILQKGLLLNFSNALAIMYAKCNELERAEVLLCICDTRDGAPWTELVVGYSRDGRGQAALDCFNFMVHEGISRNAVTYACILKVCAMVGALGKGQEIHCEVSRQEALQNNIVVGTALVDMYAKCGRLSKAQDALYQLPSRDVVSWSVLIGGYAQSGQGEEALHCYECMLCEGIFPNAVTYMFVLKACALIGALEKGKKIHHDIMNQGLVQNNISLGNALVDMYAKFSDLAMAQNVLEMLPSRNVATWNTLIAGYGREGQGEQALFCFDCMQREGVLPNAVTYACALKACASIGASATGKQIHEEIELQGLLQDNPMLGTALVDMYSKCNALTEAHDVLERLPSRNVVSWSALIAGYVEACRVDEAFMCFERMLWEGVLPNAVTYVSVLKACAISRALDKGRKIHDDIIKQGLLTGNTLLGNVLVDMYAKCGALLMAQEVLNGLCSRDVVSWSALIAGCVEQGLGDRALICYDRMRCESIHPNAVTYVCVLNACAMLGDLERGSQIHEEVCNCGFLKENINVGNALVDMYAKHGQFSKAQDVLGKIPCRDVVSWNSIIAGYVQAGLGQETLSCFKRMQHDGIRPNTLTFALVLHVCGHLGLVEEGNALFTSMSMEFGIKPDLDCFVSIVDLFGRAGHLEKAVWEAQNMPYTDSYAVWLALLGSCWKCANADIGRWAFEQALQVEKENGQAYVLMANIYVAAGMLKLAEEIEVMRYQNNAW